MRKEVIILKSEDEIEKLRASNVIVAEVLAVLKDKIAPGIETIDLERVAEEETIKRKARPAFKGYKGYPFCLCTSINDEIVHGMPTDKVLKDGDILSIDFGVEYNGYYGDAAITVPVGQASNRALRLIQAAQSALDIAIDKTRVGNRLSDISSAVQRYVEGQGYSVVKAFVGHGIGRSLHEPPHVPNFGEPGKGVRLKKGMVLAIEPMINEGASEVRVLEDGWTAKTEDGSLSAHFEHTVAIRGAGPYVLSRL
ncbi:MAG: type I methionyl aminopeptidase [Deltaproteobacteria bacterium]|nr:type I methionyl aminopeptidase [Deltaproteobacteria bacterium]